MGGAASITAIVSPVMVMVMVMVVGLQTTQYSSRLLFVLRRQLDEIHLPSRKLRLQSPPKSKVVQRLRPNPAQESFYSTILPLRRPELRAPKASFPSLHCIARVRTLFKRRRPAQPFHHHHHHYHNSCHNDGDDDDDDLSSIPDSMPIRLGFTYPSNTRSWPFLSKLLKSTWYLDGGTAKKRWVR